MNSIPTFRTLVDAPPNVRKLDHSGGTVVLGSCFGEHIGRRLVDYHFPACINPTGILYNPLSVTNVLRRLIERRAYTEEEVFFDEGQWKSFDHHSRFNASTLQQFLDTANRSLDLAADTLARSGTVILTLGTAFVFHLVSDGRVASNCHRLPAAHFTRRLVGIEEIVNVCSALFESLYENNPLLNIILTVSPVRHLRDNPHQNQASKAHLMAAIYELERRYPALYYFPSYEIMMDELRDYRFYDESMTHPSPQAIDYIWERFTTACIDERSVDFIQSYTPILQARNHRVQTPDAKASQSFAHHQLGRIDQLAERFPGVCLDRDRAYFQSILSAAKS